MNTERILSDLRSELDRINQAITVLEALDGTVVPAKPGLKPANAPKQSQKHGLTPAGRKSLSEMMKKRWAARRKAATQPAPKKATSRRTMSAAARKKIAAAQRARWAAVKKGAVKKAVMTPVPPKVRAARAVRSASRAPEPALTGLLKKMFG